MEREQASGRRRVAENILLVVCGVARLATRGGWVVGACHRPSHNRLAAHGDCAVSAGAVLAT